MYSSKYSKTQRVHANQSPPRIATGLLVRVGPAKLARPVRGCRRVLHLLRGSFPHALAHEGRHRPTRGHSLTHKTTRRCTTLPRN